MAEQSVAALDPAVSNVIEISAELACNWLANGEGILLDVREEEELEIEWIPGATAMPLSKFNPGAVADMKIRKIIVICHTGRRSRDAAERLVAYGIFDVYNVKDGLLAWNAAGLESVDQSALLI